GHLREIGRDPAQAKHNVFFMKASSCICPPNADIVRPAHVQVLDYENELGLILRQDINGPIVVTEDNLHEWIGAFVITNDVSAREEQVSAEQFHKAKSHRTFGPTGPFLVLVDANEARRWQELVIKTVVNGDVRQDCPAGDMIFGPVETLNELSRMRDMQAGDMIATGTPAGVAMKVPGKIGMFFAQMLSTEKRLSIFLNSQAKNPKVLRPGDQISLSIATPDGTLDLGVQNNRIVAAS
ncbi:MAG: fumarylacetoacetate hydrolase family protein, partial [Pseudomonadota bacterium]